MPDNQLDILIKFGLSKEKATEAVNELKKIETATKETGKAGVKAATQAAEAWAQFANRVAGSKAELAELATRLKAISEHMPLIARLGIDINPKPFVAAPRLSSKTADVRHAAQDLRPETPHTPPAVQRLLDPTSTPVPIEQSLPPGRQSSPDLNLPIPTVVAAADNATASLAQAMNQIIHAFNLQQLTSEQLIAMMSRMNDTAASNSMAVKQLESRIAMAERR